MFGFLGLVLFGAFLASSVVNPITRVTTISVPPPESTTPQAVETTTVPSTPTTQTEYSTTRFKEEGEVDKLLRVCHEGLDAAEIVMENEEIKAPFAKSLNIHGAHCKFTRGYKIQSMTSETDRVIVWLEMNQCDIGGLLSSSTIDAKYCNTIRIPSELFISKSNSEGNIKLQFSTFLVRDVEIGCPRTVYQHLNIVSPRENLNSSMLFLMKSYVSWALAETYEPIFKKCFAA